MRKLAEIIASNKKKRAEIEADADIAVRQTQLEATKRRLLLQQEEEQAQIEPAARDREGQVGERGRGRQGARGGA